MKSSLFILSVLTLLSGFASAASLDPSCARTLIQSENQLKRSYEVYMQSMARKQQSGEELSASEYKEISQNVTVMNAIDDLLAHRSIPAGEKQAAENFCNSGASWSGFSLF